MMREMASQRTGMENWGHRGQLAWLALLDQGTHGVSRVSARVPDPVVMSPSRRIASCPLQTSCVLVVECMSTTRVLSLPLRCNHRVDQHV